MKKENSLITVGKRIRYCREKNGMTQIELADAIGVGRVTLQDWENDIRPIKSDSLIAICSKLHVSADFLLGTGFFEVRPNSEEISKFTNLEILSDGDISLIFEMINGLTLKHKRMVIDTVKTIVAGL